jgi:hypothetical protein
MASGIVAAIRKYSIPVNQLTDQEIWQELQKKGYKFPLSGKVVDRRYSDYIKETAWWFDALHLAIKKARGYS